VPDGGADALLAAGTLRALVLHRVDPTRWRPGAATKAALERVPFLVALDSEQREVAQFADVVMPLGTYAESDGTFTNFASRVQRFEAAVVPPGDARAGWLVLAEILAALGGAAAPREAAAVFDELAGEGGAFAGLSFAALGDQGLPVPGAPAR
jgi:predicted molibdopterin-dependent oxidoreductase YjgC